MSFSGNRTFCGKQQTFKGFLSRLLLLYCVDTVYWSLIEVEACHVQSVQIMLAFHTKPGAYKCVWGAFRCHAVTSTPGGLLSFTGLHHTSFAFLPRNAGWGICSLIYFWTWWGNVCVCVWRGSFQALQLWKVPQAFRYCPWPRIHYMCSKMIANVRVRCVCVSKNGVTRENARRLDLLYSLVLESPSSSCQSLIWWMNTVEGKFLPSSSSLQCHEEAVWPKHFIIWRHDVIKSTLHQGCWLPRFHLVWYAVIITWSPWLHSARSCTTSE